MSDRYLTDTEKQSELAEFARYRADPNNWRKAHPENDGGSGYIDHEVLPLCDALCEIDGVCTIQSCCGHVNKYGYNMAGQLWIRLSAPMAAAFDARVGDLLAESVIYHVCKLYTVIEGREPREIVDIQFHGEADGRMPEAAEVILRFFASLEPGPGFPLDQGQAKAIVRMADAAGPAWTPTGLIEQLRRFVEADDGGGDQS